MVKPLLGRLLWAAAGHAFGSSSSSDDGSSAILHLVLLLVLGGILIGTCLEVLCHRYHVAWMPGCALATLSGVAVGTLIRVTNDPEDIPSELLFSGNILFLVCLPIIIFDAGFSLRKKEFMGSLFTIISFSVLGTLLSAFATGGILYGAGASGMCTALSWNEAMAYSSILSATDAMSSATIYSALGVDASLMTLIGGEGSLNDAMSITLYQTFAGFLEDGTAGESGAALAGRFAAMLLGSVVVGLSVGVVATFVFRYVHIGPNRDQGLIALHEWLGSLCGCHCRVRTPGGGGRAGAGTPLTGGAGGYNSLGTDAAVPSGVAGGEEGGASDAAGAAAGPAPPAGGDDGAAALTSATSIIAPYASINAVRAGSAAGPRAGLDGFGSHGGAGVVGGEVKPDSSVFTQVSFVLTLAYLSYMTAEAFHLSGVVSSLFAGIALNNFVRPLMTAEGKAFSEGTVKTLAATADTGAFFQVGVSIALTLGTAEGIHDVRGVELLLWTLFSILLGRAVSVAVLGSLVNYFRRPADKVPVAWLVLLWHAGLRGAGTYAFTLVFPTANRDLLVDVTAAVVLFTVFLLGCTTQPACYLLGVDHGHGHGGEAASHHHHSAKAAASAGGGEDGRGDTPQAALVMHGGVAYRVYVKSGARVVVPVSTMTQSEKTASALSKFDARLRWWISGVVRAD